MKISTNNLRNFIKTTLIESGIGVPQSIGVGKNYHTVNPEPISWDWFPGLEYDINYDPSGDYYAQVTVLDYPKMSTPIRKFADEATALFWVQRQYETFKNKLMNIK